ncbi:TP901 family phage tail tape measure protein, partial [Rhodomicrobium udaipurense JA643]
MANLSASLIIRMIDGVSGPARAATQALRGIGQATAALNRSVGVVAIGKQIGAQAKSMAEASSRMSAAVAPVAVAGGFGFFKAFEFEKAMNTMEALGELTASQRKDAEEYLKLLNSQYPQTLTKLAQTMNELLRGGLDMKAAMGALGPTMDLAVFGDIEPKAAGEIAINALNQFRMPMSTVEQAMASMRKVSDVITYAANKSNTDVRLMGETFKYAAPFATALGMSIEELAGASMIMANNGIKGSEAGVALRSAMVRMVKPTKGMMAMLARLNISLSDFVKTGREVTSKDIIGGLMADGVDATPVADKIAKALQDPGLKASQPRMVAELTKIISEGLGSTSIVDKDKLAENLTDSLNVAGSKVDLIGFIKAVSDKAGPGIASAIANLFDVRQGARVMTLSAGDVKAMIDGVFNEAAGYAAKGAQIMLKGIVGPFYSLMSSIEGFFVALGESGVFEDAAKVFTRLADSVREISKSSPELLRFGTYAVMAAAALVPLGMALSGAAAALAILVNPLALVVAGLGALAYYNWDSVKAGWEGIKQAATEFAGGFQTGFWDNIKPSPELNQAWADLKQSLSDAGLSLNLPSWRELGELFGGTVAKGVNLVASAVTALVDGLRTAVGWAKDAASAIGSIKMPSFWSSASVPPPAPLAAGSLKDLPARAEGGPVA